MFNVTAQSSEELWFSPELDASALRKFMRRTNLHAGGRIGVWFITCGLLGWSVVAAVGSHWLWVAIPLYGIALAFAYAPSHECAHGTAFRTRWLNEAVYWITSFVFGEEPLYRRYAHAQHHTHTWYNAEDPQKPYGKPLTLRQYLDATFGITFYLDSARQLVRNSLGRFTVADLAFLPASEVRPIAMSSRLMLTGYLLLAAWGVVGWTTWPFLLFFIPRAVGGWAVNLYVNTQHMCMREDVPDHRLTTRSIVCSRFESYWYWNMNHHIEHHLFPSVPFHALPVLHEAIANQLPAPSRGVIATNLSILQAIARQRTDRSFDLSPRTVSPDR